MSQFVRPSDVDRWDSTSLPAAPKRKPTANQHFPHPNSLLAMALNDKELKARYKQWKAEAEGDARSLERWHSFGDQS